ncbi:MAG TPA: SRPBCC family protein [Rubricoccaceae bacterium]|jgi:ligand-binding SRPBCC domain-containing protein
MTRLEVRTPIAAPPEVCFDLARDIDFHAESLAYTGERVTDRPEHRLLRLWDEVEFEGRHLGVRQRLRARIDAFDRPRHFRDVMVHGAFRSFTHDHVFEPTSGGSVMIDRLQFAAPLWPLGVVVERAALVPYLRRLIAGRGQEIKAAAERASAAESAAVGRHRA